MILRFVATQRGLWLEGCRRIYAISRPPAQRPFHIRAIEENPSYVIPVEQYEQNLETPTTEDTGDSAQPTGDSEKPKRLTLKDISPQVRHALMLKARKKKVQVVIGKAGVNPGLLMSVKSHFRRHVVVRAKVAKNYADNVAGIAQELEEGCGGIILERAGRTILIYRGFQENEVPTKERLMELGWWNQFEKETP